MQDVSSSNLGITDELRDTDELAEEIEEADPNAEPSEDDSEP